MEKRVRAVVWHCFLHTIWDDDEPIDDIRLPAKPEWDQFVVLERAWDLFGQRHAINRDEYYIIPATSFEIPNWVAMELLSE